MTNSVDYKSSQDRSIAPALALTWTGSLLLAATLLTRWENSLFASMLTVACLALIARQVAALTMICWIVMPIALPLIIIHGIVNPAYPATFVFLHWIKVRPGGIVFATVTGARLVLLAAAFVIWRFTDRRWVLVFFQKLHFPTQLLCLLAVGISTTHTILTRARAVHLAQQARGIRWSGGRLRRLISLPPLVIPTITGALLDGGNRGAIMEHRGLGSADLIFPKRWLGLRTASAGADWVPVFLPLLVVLVGRFLS